MPLPFILILALTFGAALAAEADRASTSAASAAASEAGDADGQLAQALQAMRDSDTDRSRGVDAAILLLQARELYQKRENWDKVVEVNSCLYWCRKRMSAKEIDQYLARMKDVKTTDLGTVRGQMDRAVTAVQEVAGTTVVAGEAPKYLERAEGFAKGSPDKHFEIYIRFLEVAERFQELDVAVATQANRQAGDALRRFSEEVRSKADAVAKQAEDVAKKVEDVRKKDADVAKREEALSAQVDTIFTKPRRIATKGLAMPSSTVLSTASRKLREDYKEKLARTAPQSKIKLAKKFLDMARSSQDVPAKCKAYLDEALRLAQSVKDVPLILEICDFLGETFKDVDADKEKRALLGKISGSVPKAVLTLLGDPCNGPANSEAGLTFCFASPDPTPGLRMLATGSEETLKSLARMELSAPTEWQRQKEVADAWYALAQANSAKDFRMDILAHARIWYDKALAADAQGDSRGQAEKRSQEILALTPFDISVLLDPKNKKEPSPEEWDRIQAPVIPVDGGKAFTDTHCGIPPGRRVLVVPHPKETWTLATYGEALTVNWHGRKSRYIDESLGGFNLGEMILMTGKQGPNLHVGVVPGPAQLYVRKAGDYGSNGIIRIKVVPLDDD